MFKNRSLFIIGVIAVVNALGYGIIIPILYSYSKHFGMSDFQNGLLFSIFSLCSFISAPIIGRLSDKYGRRPLLITSIAGTAVSFFMAAFAPSALFLFLARALDGITAGNLPVAAAVIADTTEIKDRAKGFGIIGAAFGFGFVFGPAISAFTVRYGIQVPFIIAGVISVVAVVITAIFLPETNKHMGQIEHKGKLFDFPLLARTLVDEKAGATLLISLLYMFAFSMAMIYGFQPFSRHVLHMTDTQIALVFTMFGLVGLITQVAIIGRLSKFVGIKKLFMTSLATTTMVLFAMSLSRTIPIFIGVSVLLALSNSFGNPLIQTILSKETDAKSQGSILGLNTSYQSIGSIFGPILGGLLATYYAPLPMMAGGLVLGVCFFIAFKIRLTVQKEHLFN